jgi:hypothetical protein
MIDDVTQAWFYAGAAGPGFFGRPYEVAEINTPDGDISHCAILAGRAGTGDGAGRNRGRRGGQYGRRLRRRRLTDQARKYYRYL